MRKTYAKKSTYGQRIKKFFCSKKKNLDQINRNLNSDKIKVAVRNLSLSFQNGEITGILGPNGAGKTTTIDMITAERIPDAGSLKINGQDLKVTSLKTFYQNIGLCPQYNPFWDELTTREHLLIYASVKKMTEYLIFKKCNE